MADRVVLLNAGPHRAERPAGRPLRDAGQHVRRALHRHAADEPAAAGRRRGRERHRGRRRTAPRCRRTAPAARWACGRSTSSSRSSAACVQGWPAWSILAPIRSSSAGSGRIGRGARRRARWRRRRATRSGCTGRKARPTISMRTDGGPARTAVAKPRRPSRKSRPLQSPGRSPCCHECCAPWPPRSSRRSCPRPRWRAGHRRGAVLLSDRRRRSDHQDRRRLRRGLREGEPRRQAEADLHRQLPGHDRQGAHVGQERRAAGDVDPAVDRHVHADRRGRDRAVRRPRQDARGQGVAGELLSRASWRTAAPGARPGASPSSARPSCCTGTRRCSRRPGSTRTGRPATWKEMLDYAQKLTKRDASGKVTQWGIQIPSSGLPVLAVPGARDPERRQPDERRRDRDLLRPARGDRGAAVLGRPRAQAQGASGGHRRVGHDAEGLLRAQDGDDVDDDGQPHERPQQRQVRLRRRDAAGRQAARQPDGRRQLLRLQEVDAGAARSRLQVRQVGHARRRAPRSGASTRATSPCCPPPTRRRR